jgi:adenine-specific DNA-methyltransferase
MCRQEAILQSVSQRNAAFFEAEANKLDGWAEDLKVGLEREIKELDRQIRETRRAATAAPTLQEKLEAQKYVKSLEAHRNILDGALFDAQDDIDRLREQLIADIEGKLRQKTTLQELFSIRWKII